MVLNFFTWRLIFNFFYSFLRQVSDGDNISKSTLVVEILDENDNRPKFDKDFYDVVLPHGNNSALIAKIHAVDPDSGPRGEIYYNFSTPNNIFHIDENTGFFRIHCNST